jgi:DNA-binding transcriptional LysR family regulator
MIDIVIMRISFDLLEVLAVVADSRSFQDGARQLKISQPAVSFKLKRLQEQVELPLFTLQGKKKILTAYGRELAEVAKRQLERSDHAVENLERRYLSAEGLTLRVGCRREIFESVSERLAFAGRLEHHALSNLEAVHALGDQTVDLAISYERPDSAEVIGKKIFESGAVFAVHRKLLRKGASLEALARDREFLTQTPCLFYQAGGQLIESWVKSVGLKPEDLRIRCVAQDWRTLAALVDQGLGYAVLPEYVVEENPDVVQFTLPTRIFKRYAFYAYFRKDLRSVPAFREILDRL